MLYEVLNINLSAMLLLLTADTHIQSAHLIRLFSFLIDGQFDNKIMECIHAESLGHYKEKQQQKSWFG